MAAALALCAAGPSAARGAEPVPGVVAASPPTAADIATIERGGGDEVRFLVLWRTIEPEPGIYDFSSMDAIAESARGRGVALVPFVYGSPPWISADESHAPIARAVERSAWRNLLKALVDRYGHGGSFWSGQPGSNPIRKWQIWNEPNFDLYWEGQPSARGYARLLRISAGAIRGADPGAVVIAAGIAPIRDGIVWWRYLRQLYRVPGFRGSYDRLALHPYSRDIDDLRLQVELVRRIMRSQGDATTPLAITEVGWASGGDPSPLVVSPSRQARLLTRAFDLLAAPRFRILEIDWYSFRDTLETEPACSFCAQTGLFAFDGRPKPAWRAFRRAARPLGD